MKRVSMFFGFYFILFCSLVNGGLLKDLAESLHEKAHNIRDDIREVLHPNKENLKNEKTDSKTSDILNKNENTNEKVNTSETAIVFPDTDMTMKVSTVKPDMPVSPSTAKSTNATDTKDGRENFAGGCSTGFKRTADGRCAPTF